MNIQYLRSRIFYHSIGRLAICIMFPDWVMNRWGDPQDEQAWQTLVLRWGYKPLRLGPLEVVWLA